MTIENTYLLKLKKLLRDRAPMLFATGASLYFKNFKFKEEKEYIKGSLSAESKLPSLILLSCNRAATQLVEEVLKKIYEHGGGRHIALNRYLFFFGTSDTAQFLDSECMVKKMEAKGFFFGQQGPFTEHDCFSDYKLVVMTRDPRDLLVSHFHSFTKAHVPRNKHFVSKIAEAKEMGLQKYVLLDEHVIYFKRSLEQAVKLRTQENVLFWKYEDMMENFSSFQEECQHFIHGEIDSGLSKQVSLLYKKPEGAADNTRHRRSGAWGQFKSELEPEVVDQLNEIFGGLLEELNYPLN